MITARVKHSQRLSVAPWVAVKQAGIIITAHCNCMAGLGEACSHISAILFTLDANTQVRKTFSCTSLLCSWLPPTFKSVPFAQIADIDFSVPSHKKKRSLEPEQTSSAIVAEPCKLTPSSQDLDTLYKKLSEAGKPVILSLVPKYCETYVPLCEQEILPKPLTDLFKEEYLDLSYPDLLACCESCYDGLTITTEQSKAVEQKTKQQCGSKVWFQQRAGRITASRFKAAACTDIAQPSQSLIKAICYPKNHLFKTRATAWGCEHERTARDAYIDEAEKTHIGLVFSLSGLVLHIEYPHMGASPDGIVSCECCGQGVIEIKCPFSCIDKTFLESTSDQRFCLELVNGMYRLRRDHTYFYQMQAQMKFCEFAYGDFVVWREDELIVERINPDHEFLSSALEKSTEFFKYGELLGKWYTKLPSQLQVSTSESSSVSPRENTLLSSEIAESLCSEDISFPPEEYTQV